MGRVPPNCVFEIDDFETDWVYGSKFDFIHGRELEGCVSDEDKLFAQAFKHLKSGGYFEFDGAYTHWLSDDDTAQKAENCQFLAAKIHEAANKFGKSFDNVPLWKAKMEKAGFVDVKEFVYKVKPNHSDLMIMLLLIAMVETRRLLAQKPQDERDRPPPAGAATPGHRFVYLRAVLARLGLE